MTVPRKRPSADGSNIGPPLPPDERRARELEAELLQQLRAELLQRLRKASVSRWPALIASFVAHLRNWGAYESIALLALFADLAEQMRQLPQLADRPPERRDYRLSAMWNAVRSASTPDEMLTLLEQELITWVTASRVRTTVVSAHVQRAKTFIKGHSHQQVTLKSVGAAVGRQHQYLATLFRQEAGITIHEYLTCVRIRHAWNLIRAGEKIEAVALQVGYRSKKNFYRQFKSHVGLDPGACSDAFRRIPS
jgi:AraC-like DNA-binding protein